MAEPISVAAIIDADTVLRVSSKGWVTLLAEPLEYESGAMTPAQTIRVDFVELVNALSTVREQLKEALGYDPFDRPEDRKVDSDT